VASDVDVADGGEAEGVEGIGDGLALRIEQPLARDDMDGDAEPLHGRAPSGERPPGGVTLGRVVERRREFEHVTRRIASTIPSS
jgi:hypothetical protein